MSAESPALPRLGSRAAGAAAAALVALGLLLIVAMLALLFGVQQQPSCAATPGAAQPIVGEPIPAYLVPFYEGAAARYRLGARGPAVLAAINRIESGFGQNPGVSSAGAIGWMQFQPSTWAKYGVDANGDGKRDPYDPQDAIYGAANYLRASGAPRDWQAAVFSYNHAQWYVDEVLSTADEYQAAGLTASAAPGFDCGGDGGVAPTGRFAALLHEADRISAKNFPYVWGGGHQQPAPDPDHTTGYDCSGAVSRLVQAAGYPYPTADTTVLEQEWKLPRGPGKVTVYLKATGPEAHVFVGIRVGGRERFWGTSGFARPNGGAGWFTRSPGAAYLRGFVAYHLPGPGA